MNILFVVGTFSVIEPLGVLYISAALKKNNHKTFIVAADDINIENSITQNKIDVVAFGFMSTEARSMAKMSLKIRELFPEIIMIAGGPHPTYYPSIVDKWPLDAVIIGEGELVINELIERLKKKEGLSKLPNIQTKTIKKSQREIVNDLDNLPYPDREILDNIAPYKHIRMRSFFATRGCPFSCAYCFNSAYNDMFCGSGNILRRRSPENLIHEIEIVKDKYPMDFLRFGDDVFAMKHDAWIEEFCDKYKARVKLPFYFLIHPNFIEDSLIRILKEAGCHSVMLGIESGIPELRKKILDRYVSDEKIKNGFKILNKYNIKIFSNAMLALPDSTLEDDLYSLKYTLDCSPTYAGFTFCTPFPGTKLHKLCLEKGYLKKEDNPDDYIPNSMQTDSCLNSISKERKDIIRNIIQLAPIANYFPFMRKLIIHHLIYWSPNGFFNFIGFVVRNYIITKIFPFRKSPLAFFAILKKVLRIDRNNYDTK